MEGENRQLERKKKKRGKNHKRWSKRIDTSGKTGALRWATNLRGRGASWVGLVTWMDSGTEHSRQTLGGKLSNSEPDMPRKTGGA